MPTHHRVLLCVKTINTCLLLPFRFLHGRFLILLTLVKTAHFALQVTCSAPSPATSIKGYLVPLTHLNDPPTVKL